MNWEYLNKVRIRTGQLATTVFDGFNGMFLPRVGHRRLLCIISDGVGWQHVSVSIPGSPNETPTWADMCAVKDLFWEPEECVMQLHPPHSQYVNMHKGCLHLWKPLDAPIPMPPGWMVGYTKECQTEEEVKAAAIKYENERQKK